LLESKEHTRVRHIRSPDEWDAVALTFAEPVKEPYRRIETERPRPMVAISDPSRAWMGAWCCGLVNIKRRYYIV
jgi:hypothetical protein